MARSRLLRGLERLPARRRRGGRRDGRLCEIYDRVGAYPVPPGHLRARKGAHRSNSGECSATIVYRDPASGEVTKSPTLVPHSARAGPPTDRPAGAISAPNERATDRPQPPHTRREIRPPRATPPQRLRNASASLLLLQYRTSTLILRLDARVRCFIRHLFVSTDP